MEEFGFPSTQDARSGGEGVFSGVRRLAAHPASLAAHCAGRDGETTFQARNHLCRGFSVWDWFLAPDLKERPEDALDAHRWHVISFSHTYN